MKKIKNGYIDKWFTIPNLVTFVRIIGSLALIIYILLKEYITAGMVFAALLIVLTDKLDGFIARRFDMVSTVGKGLDPIADKVFNWGIGITLLYMGIIPFFSDVIVAISLCIILLRDIIIACLSIYEKFKFTHNKKMSFNEKKKVGRELGVTFAAKAKMVAQSVGTIGYMLAYSEIVLPFGLGVMPNWLIEFASFIAPIGFVTAAIFAIIDCFLIFKHEYPERYRKFFRLNKKGF